MTAISVISDYREYTTRKPATDDRWDNGDRKRVWTVEGLKIGEDEHRLEIADAVPGDYLHLVYAVWDTGDSFGRYEGNYMECFAVYRTYEKAQAAQQTLYAADDKNHRAIIVLEDGTEMSYYIPWFGYFDCLNYIQIESFVLRG